MKSHQPSIPPDPGFSRSRSNQTRQPPGKNHKISHSKCQMNIVYQHSRLITDQEFIDILKRSTLAERRPIDDLNCIRAMLEHADLLCTAWDDSKLVGVARSVTDFEYCCYLSDLAVDQQYQRKGIGKELIRLTKSKLGDKAKIILLAAPNAESYYRHVGFEPPQSAWILTANEKPRSQGAEKSRS
jgi:predicted N-acetyltransferase YhbS